MLSRQGPHWPASPRLLCIMHLAICLRGRAGACSNGIFGAPFVSDMVSSMPPAPHLVHRRCPFAGHHAHRPLCPSPTHPPLQLCASCTSHPSCASHPSCPSYASCLTRRHVCHAIMSVCHAHHVHHVCHAIIHLSRLSGCAAMVMTSITAGLATFADKPRFP